MRLKIEPQVLKQLKFWKKNDPKMFAKVWRLIEAVTHNPYQGIGKPKPLRDNLSGKWSRRITREYRLIYEIVDQSTLVIFSCRYHYE